MIFKFTKRSPTPDEDLQECFRQRLKEVLEPAGNGGRSPSAPPESLPPVTQPASQVVQYPPVQVQTDEPAALFAEGQEAPLPAPVAPEAPPLPAQSEALPAEVLGKAASRELKEVRGEVAGLRDSLDAQQHLIETDVLTVIARIGQSLEKLDKTLQSQAEAIASLGSAREGLLRSLQAVLQRLDAQAKAVRDLSAAVSVQQNCSGQYRSAVEKLRELTARTGPPVRLPEDL